MKIQPHVEEKNPSFRAGPEFQLHHTSAKQAVFGEPVFACIHRYQKTLLPKIVILDK